MHEQEEYVSVELKRLVNEALGKNDKAFPLTLFETRIFSSLHDKLSHYLPVADVSLIISDLRKDFLAGFSHPSAQNLHKLASKCVLCQDVDGSAIDPWWNLYDPDLMIVVENPSTVAANKELLISTLKEAGFKSNRVCLTFASRCPVKGSPEDDVYANCSSWLHTEVVSLNPKLIVTLGSKPYGVLSGDVISKMTDVEGKVLWFGAFPICPAMSLNWYARSSDGENKRILRVFKTAYRFLYSSEVSNERS